MSIKRNNIVRSVAPKSLFESLKPVLSASSTWNQGDLLAFDATNKIVIAATGAGSAANILGVARNTMSSGKMPSPYQGTDVDASQAIEDAAGPVYGVVASLVLATGAAFNPGDPVYISSTDPQTVGSSATGSSVGIFVGAAVASAAAGQYGDILVGARYGMSGIEF